MRRSRKAAAFGAVVLGSLVVAVSASARLDATSVAVTAGKPSEFKFALAKTSGPKGAFTFKVTNKGKTDHDFKIAGKKVKTLKPGKSLNLTVTISKAGKYQYLCTLTGHAAAGMKGTFTVK